MIFSVLRIGVKLVSKQEWSDLFVIREDGFIKIPQESNLAWLSLFYALPKELVKKRPVYLELPRNIKRLLREKRYQEMLNDSFLELVWDCYAWSIWQFLKVPEKGGGYREIPGDWSHYSGEFPLWRISYEMIRSFREAFESELDWSFQRLFTAPETIDVPWLSYQQFSNLVGNLTDKIVADRNLQPVIDAVWENLQPEDYNKGKNVSKRDFLRSWNHDRKYAHLSIEEIRESGAAVEGNSLYDLADSRSDFEARMLSKVQVQQFQQSLGERDKRILSLRMEGKTLQEIANAVGYKTAGAVKKRIDKIAEAYKDYTEPYGKF